jgi:hypothetical protein
MRSSPIPIDSDPTPESVFTIYDTTHTEGQTSTSTYLS